MHARITNASKSTVTSHFLTIQQNAVNFIDKKMWGWLFNDASDPSEVEVIMEKRARITMQTLCNAIETDPRSDHTQKLVEEYTECASQISMETGLELRAILLRVLGVQIELIMTRENWDDERLQFLKNWESRVLHGDQQDYE